MEVASTAGSREILLHTSAALSAAVPHLLWVLFTIHRSSGEFCIACWQSGGRRPRVVALIAGNDRILESDADTLCALAAAQSTSDILTHVRWVELLGREAITRRFFCALTEVVDTVPQQLPSPVGKAARKEIAVLTISRLLFLSFLEAKGWLGGDFDFLANQFARCMVSGGSYHRTVLRPLFFGTLNTRVPNRAERALAFGKIPFLNGGLFTRTALEKAFPQADLPDDAFSEIFSRLLTTFRFSAREESGVWSETAVDPEILGKTFEALMAAEERKTGGAFYTPQRLVEHITESGFVTALSPVTDSDTLRALLAAGEIPDPESRTRLLVRIQSLRIIDPACGSGAFLVHALDRVADLRLRLGETGTASTIRRKSLVSSIYGVDINPMAVWLCQLRLWLAIVIDSADPDPMHVLPLPNLDRQIRIGDSLSGKAFTSNQSGSRGQKLAQLKCRYARAVGSRKKGLARQLDREERREAIAEIERQRSVLSHRRRDIVLAARSPDLFGVRTQTARTLDSLRSLRKAARAATARGRRLKAGAALPFSFTVHFADVNAFGGFDLVIGNPPWVRIHHISAQARAELKQEYESFSRAAWREGADLAGSGRAFANQVDLASLFIERSVHLLRDSGALALLVPAKIWRSLSGGGVRAMVARTVEITALEDMTESRSGFDAAVYPSLIVGRRSEAKLPRGDSHFAAAVHRRGSALQWEMTADRLPLDHTRGSPWLLLPDQVRASFEKLSRMGHPLAESRIGRPVLGVKTGCNAAFVIGPEDNTTGMEPALLRPVVRGETLTPWVSPEVRERIIWTHGRNGAPLPKLPPGTLARLSKWRRTLERRSDHHGSSRWWSLYRTEGASSRLFRVVWCDFGKIPRAFLAPAESDIVPLNTCYVARCERKDDALALMVLLNGPLLSAWLNTIAEPARGGYRRYLGWTMSLMPLPNDWERAVKLLAPLGERALAGSIPDQLQLMDASLEAYRLKRRDMEPLISWTQRT
ncbi:MAG: SAM-dependent methyltransferase [Gemmatimonadota bacterium]|nr:SAM-dependent methyltransferase [Gemmatimonadota bacterium]